MVDSSTRLQVGLDDVWGHFQPERLYDSVDKWIIEIIIFQLMAKYLVLIRLNGIFQKKFLKTNKQTKTHQNFVIYGGTNVLFGFTSKIPKKLTSCLFNSSKLFLAWFQHIYSWTNTCTLYYTSHSSFILVHSVHLVHLYANLLADWCDASVKWNFSVTPFKSHFLNL